MRYLIKIDRIAAWIMFICLILYFISGYGMTKGIIDRTLATKMHLDILTYIILTVFVVHTGFAIHLAFKRWRIWNLFTKILLVAFYLFFASSFIWVDLFYSPATNRDLFPSMTVSPSGSPFVLPAGTAITLDMAEISRHSQSSDCWLLINNKVYDVTNFLSAHPGGSNTITPYCGREASNAFATKDIGRPHSSFADSLLVNYYIGDLNQKIGQQQIQQNIQKAIQATPPQGMGNKEEEDD